MYEDFKFVAHEQVPFSIKRTVIDLHHLTDRCEEEMELLEIEIARLVNYYTKWAFGNSLKSIKQIPHCI